MSSIPNCKQLYCCCGCSLRIGSILIGIIELLYPVMFTCSPQKQPDTVIGIMWVLFVSSSIILLFGSIKELPSFLFGWIIYRSAVMFLNIIGFVYLIIEAYTTYLEKSKLIIFFLLSMIFYLVLNGYFWTIVFSYYHDLKEREKRKNMPPPVYV